MLQCTKEWRLQGNICSLVFFFMKKNSFATKNNKVSMPTHLFFSTEKHGYKTIHNKF